MEEQQQQQSSWKKPKNKIIKFLPKVVSLIKIQNHSFSTGRDPHHHHHYSYSNNHDHQRFFKSPYNYSSTTKGFSGPIVSIIPEEARRKSKKQSADQSLEGPEHDPTSPKVSCIGQIKCKNAKKDSKKQVASKTKEAKTTSDVGTKTATTSKSEFSATSRKKAHTNQASKCGGKEGVEAPKLGQLKKFSSGRDAFASFDWNYYSDAEEEVIVPFSAPLSNDAPRKHINIWKRRSLLHPPTPLLLSTSS